MFFEFFFTSYHAFFHCFLICLFWCFYVKVSVWCAVMFDIICSSSFVSVVVVSLYICKQLLLLCVSLSVALDGTF